MAGSKTVLVRPRSREAAKPRSREAAKGRAVEDVCVDGAIPAFALWGRAMTRVLLVAQSEALAGRAAPVLEAGALEVTVATQFSFPSALRPRVVVVVAEKLVEPWFSAVADLLRTRSWVRRTLVVAPLTGDNIEAMQRASVGLLYPLVGLDGEFAKAVARLAYGSSWEDGASVRMQALLGVTDRLCLRFVAQAFAYAPSCPALGELCLKGLYTSPRNLRSRWQTRGLPGSPKQVLDRIVALRFAELRRGGASVAAARAALGLHRSTMHRLIRRVAGVTPGEVDEDRVWAASPSNLRDPSCLRTTPNGGAGSRETSCSTSLCWGSCSSYSCCRAGGSE